MIRRIAALAVVVGLACVFACPAAMRETEAAWADTEQSNGTFAAGTVAPVTAMTCTPAIGSTRFTWTAPSGGLTRGSYRWTVTGAVTGSGTLASNATTVQLSTGLLGIGSGTFSLYAVGPGGWESAAVRGSVTVVLGLLWGCSVP